MRRSEFLALCACVPALLAIGPAARAADDLDALKARFKARYPQLAALKRAGKVGETSEGYVEAVDRADAAAAAVAAQENADRKALYAALAAQEGVTPAQVAARNAARNFEKAQPGEFLKKGGTWARKKG